MQNKLSQLGYFTVDAALDLPQKKEGQRLLDTCYKGNKAILRQIFISNTFYFF